MSDFDSVEQMKSHILPLVLSLIALQPACTKKKDAAEIKIGEYASLTGGTATFGQSSHKGTQLAIDELNAAGGVLGKKLTLITEDDQSKPEEAHTAALKLIQQDGVVALLGEVASSRSIAAARRPRKRRFRLSARPARTPSSPPSAITSSASALSIPSRARSWRSLPRAP